MGELTTVLRVGRSRRLMLPGASLEQAVHHCLDLASPYGAIRLLPPSRTGVRQFIQHLEGKGSRRFRWTFRCVEGGIELAVIRLSSMTWLTTVARRASTADLELERKLDLLPHILNLNIVVLGGGTGLYTTLLGLRDRTSSLTAVISGLPKPQAVRKPKDELGWLPRDDASICLVALSPTVGKNIVLRSLLGHRMRGGHLRGAHVGTVILEALSELRGGKQAALDETAHLLGIRGRIVLARDSDGADGPPTHLSATAAMTLSQADMVVVAPGHMGLDVRPVLCNPALLDAVRASPAVKVFVTATMSAPGDGSEPTTSSQVARLAEFAPIPFDVVLANSGSFGEHQIRAYAAEGARPIVPDAERTMRVARQLVTQELAASGDLARHNPERLGECLVEIGISPLLASIGQACAAGA